MTVPSEEESPDRDSWTAEGSSVESTVDTAMSGLFGRDSVYMVLWVLQVCAAAAVTPVITRLLGLREFGGVALAVAVMQVLSVLAGCGLPVAIQRRFAERRGEAAAARLLTASTVLALVVTAVAFATGPWWGPLLGVEEFPVITQLAVVWAGATAATSSCLGLLRSQDRLGPYAAVSVVQSVGAMICGLLLVLIWQATAEAFLVGQVVAQVATLAGALTLTRPRLLRTGDRALIGAGLRFGLPLIPAMLGGLLLGTADRFVLSAQLGPDAVARYQIAYNIGSLPMLVLLALDSSWLPRIFAVEDPQHREAVLAASRRALYRLLAPVMAGLSLCAPLILRVWAPPEFRTDDLLLVTAIVIVSATHYAGTLSATRGLLSRSATGTVAAAAVVATAANLGLNLVLVPAHGLLGAAVATLAAYALQHGILVLRSATGRAIGTALSGAVPIASGSLIALLAVVLPVHPEGLAIRAVLATGCLWWFLRVLLRIAPASGRHRPRRPLRRTPRDTPG